MLVIDTYFFVCLLLFVAVCDWVMCEQRKRIYSSIVIMPFSVYTRNIRYSSLKIVNSF